ncbi:nitrilase-related carbon-nitrogen hydrolase [Pengzhenrongella sp.]|uniref:nitrilase-related carbon-nitrogen hydrolase n=1 Tax=Pengzhenrongella sp. TaxID=2888820 RepID=UPI002F945268
MSVSPPDDAARSPDDGASPPGPPVRPLVRVTIGQLSVGDDHAANRRDALAALDAAATTRADLLVLPEYASGFDPRGVGPQHAEPLTGPFVTALRERAAATGVAVIAGMTLPGSRPDRAVNAVVAVARAIENTAVVLAVGQAGLGVVGRSLVVGADGDVRLELDEAPAVVTTDVDAGAIDVVRERNPSLANRRYSVVPRVD